MTEPRLRTEQRRALAMLATSGHNGQTRPFLVAHGFGDAMITGLVNRGLVIMTPEKILAGDCWQSLCLPGSQRW